MRQQKELDVNIANIEERVNNIKTIVTELTSELKILKKKISKRVKRTKKETIRNIAPELALFMNQTDPRASRESVIRSISKYVKKDDIILMPAINFIASYNMAKTMDLKIYLVDVDEYTGQITPNKIVECTISKKDFFKKIKLRCRIDTIKELEYFKAGGILQFVLNSIIAKAS